MKRNEYLPDFKYPTIGAGKRTEQLGVFIALTNDVSSVQLRQLPIACNPNFGNPALSSGLQKHSHMQHTYIHTDTYIPIN